MCARRRHSTTYDLPSRAATPPTQIRGCAPLRNWQLSGSKRFSLASFTRSFPTIHPTTRQRAIRSPSIQPNFSGPSSGARSILQSTPSSALPEPTATPDETSSKARGSSKPTHRSLGNFHSMSASPAIPFEIFNLSPHQFHTPNPSSSAPTVYLLHRASHFTSTSSVNPVRPKTLV